MTAVVVAVVLAAVTGLVLWIRRTGVTDQQLAQAQAAADAAEKRRVEQEKIDAAARKQRTEEFNAKVDANNDPASAVDVLRDASSRVNSH